MLKISFKKFFLYSAIVIFIFILDRISKLYILNLVEINNEVDIYIFSFLKLYLIWNKGVAFGLFSFEQNSFAQHISIYIFVFLLLLLWFVDVYGCRQVIKLFFLDQIFFIFIILTRYSTIINQN